MDYDLKEHGLITILRLKGDLSFKEVEELGSILHKVVHDTSGEIVVDFSQVGHADAIVAGQFVAAKREADIQRREFVLSNLSPSVKKVLHAAHADNLIKTYDTSEAAIADLAERARGGTPRRIIPHIECEHDDCVFYTYAKVGGGVTPACEYSYPEEIINGPNCPCYRVNWKQYQASAGAEAHTPLPRRSKQVSVYSARDRYPREDSSGMDLPARLTPAEARVADEEERVEELESSFPQPDRVVYEETDSDYELPPLTSGTADETRLAFAPPEVEEDVIEEVTDPFADDNFPSSQEILPPEPVQVAPPAPSKPMHFPAADSPPAVAPAPKPVPLKPEEVVKRFVEAWNGGRFDWEFECLASPNRGLSSDEYFARRRLLKNAQVEKFGRATHQTVHSVDSSSIQDDHATLLITRLDRTPRGTRCYEQLFHLKKEKQEWKVIRVEDGEEKKNPTVPPKGRTMKAGDFLGRGKNLEDRKKPKR